MLKAGKRWFSALMDTLVGEPLPTHEEEEHKVGAFQGIPMLGLDALGSSAYGPEAALTVLLPLGLVGLRYLGPIILVILVILALLYFSYRQTIAAYPTGGGSYTVAKENLGTRFGLLAAAALMLDYVLNVAVGISAGVAALVSALPALHRYILPLCLAILVLIALVNLRGIRESGVAWALPTYLFVLSMFAVLATGIFKCLTHHNHPAPVAPPPALPPAAGAVSLWLLVRSFASGCTAMTGVEAVSNGVTAFAKPAERGAQRTLTAIVLILALLLAGIAYVCHAYGIGAMDQDRPDYQSVISQIVGAVVGRGWAYYVTLASVLSVLCLSANTSFAGFPRLCHLLGEDDFLPHGFANKGRRLVYSLGISILTVFSGVLLILFGGITDRLIPLFAVGAFLAFTLSQAGMVAHWRREGGRHAHLALVVNGVGTAATGVALAVVLVAKFRDGAWITLLLIPALLMLFYRVKRHYEHVERETGSERPLDVTHLEPPIVVIPMVRWSTVTEKGLRFGLRLSNDVVAIHVAGSEDEGRDMCARWPELVEAPLRNAGLPVPSLETVESPRRHLISPIVKKIYRIEQENPDRQIAVLIPELIGPQWWSFMLHNQRASLMKAAFYLSGDRRIVVINVPWYLSDPSPDVRPGSSLPTHSVPIHNSDRNPP